MNRSLDRRYLDDNQFRALVDTIEATLASSDFTTTDMREALLLAQIKYEMKNPRKVMFSPDLQKQIDFMMKSKEF